jgi:hypothetical protein
MNKKIINVLMFTAGAAIGSGVTWYITKTRYERILQEEIESVKETWAQMNQNDYDEAVSDDEELDDIEDTDDDDCCAEEDDFAESDMIDYSRIASRYTTSGKKTEDTKDAEDADNDGEGEGDTEVPYINGPYVIDPSDFADGDFDHDCYCLTYYNDGVLANDWWETFDVDETIGLDAIEHFGDVVEDIVHVRNERLKADYEVARDPRNYADLIANDPRLAAHAD